MTEKKSKQNDEISGAGMVIIRNLPRLDLIDVYVQGIENKVQDLIAELDLKAPANPTLFHIKVIQTLLDNIKSEVQASVDEYKHKEV